MERWKKDGVHVTRPSTVDTTSGMAGKGRGQEEEDEEEQSTEQLDQNEREVHRKDENDAKKLMMQIFEMCEGTVEELISVVAVSGNLSLRMTLSGFDVHRIFFDDMEEEKERRAAVKAEALEELREKQRQRKQGL